MSSVPNQSSTAPATTERRAHWRKRLDQLAYIGFGPDTGGVLLDISEEGLRCQIVGAVIEGDQCHLKFALPGRHSPIEADGQVVWSNSSRQGGGVRLVGLGPDVRLELQQWISEEMALSGASTPVPVPVRTTSVGAVHVPQPTTAELPVSASVSQPGDRQAPVEPEAAAATARDQVPQVGKTAPDAMTPQAAPVAIAQKSSSRREQPRPATTSAAKPRLPLAVAHTESRTRPFIIAAVTAGCAVVGVVALVFSGINPPFLFSGRGTGTAIAAPATPAVAAAPKFPAIENETSPQSEFGLQADAMEALPAGDVADAPPLTLAPPARPEPPAANTASTPAARPTPRPPAQPARSQPLAMALARPRAANPASPGVAAPEAPIAPLAPPAAPLMEMTALASRSAELPQPPVRPPADADYRQPQLLSSVQPVYSSFARQARLQGTVRVNATVGTDGVPRSPVCLSGNTMLCQMAIEAVGKWRYQPATSNGQPVEAPMLITFNFQLR